GPHDNATKEHDHAKCKPRSLLKCILVTIIATRTRFCSSTIRIFPAAHGLRTGRMPAVVAGAPFMVTRSEHPFSAPYAPPDDAVAATLFAEVPRAAAAERRIDARASRLIEGIRARTGGLGGIEDFLHAYSLSTKEGLALMVLAEALLRVPDATTADRLIEDK